MTNRILAAFVALLVATSVSRRPPSRRRRARTSEMLASDRGSRDARRAPRASGSRRNTSPRNSRASARGRCPAAPTCSCPSSSRPAAATAARASRSRVDGGGAQGFAAGQVQALSFSDDAEVTGPASSPATVSSSRSRRALATTVTPRSTSRTRSSSSCATSPKTPTRPTRAILARYSDLRYKAMAARQRGARALLVVTGPRSPNAGQVIPMSFDTALAGSGIPAASIGGQVADALFGALQPARSLRDIQQELDSGNPHVAGFPLPATLTLKTAVVRERQQGRNVVAYLPATTSAANDKPWVALGAHYDHLGRGGHGNSLASKEDAGGIHHGADDNASGTAAVIAIAEALSKQPRRRNVLFALWSAEEIGLVGSAAFVAMPPVAARSARGLSELRHGRPHAEQPARGPGHRDEPRVGARTRAGERGRGVRPGRSARSLPADGCRELQPGWDRQPLRSRRGRTPTITSRRTPPRRSTTKISTASSISPPPSSARLPTRTRRRNSRKSINPPRRREARWPAFA